MAPTLGRSNGSSPISMASTCCFSMLEGAHQIVAWPEPEWLQADIEGLGGHLHRLQHWFVPQIIRIHEESYLLEARHHLLEQLDSLHPDFRTEHALAGDISARSRDAGNDA